MKRTLTSIFLCLMAVMSVYAQDAEPLTISFASGAPDMYVGESVSVNIQFTKPADVKEIINASLTMAFNGETKTIPVTINENIWVVTNPVSVTPSVMRGTHELVFTLKSDVIKGETDTTAVSYSASISFNAWEHANAKLSGDTRSMVGIERIFKFEHTAGKETGWSNVTWTINGVEQASHSSELSYIPNEADGNQELTIKASATCTVGENIEHVERDIRVYVYKLPIVTPPENRVYEYNTDDKSDICTLKFEYNGGCTESSASGIKQGWEFIWYEDGKVIESANSNEYTLPRFDDNKKITYTVECHNWFDNQDMLADHNRIEYIVNVYANPRIDEECLNQSGIMNEEMVLRAASKGGYELGWKYEWTNTDGKTVSSDILNVGKLPVFSEESHVIRGYKLRAINYHKDGSLWFDETRDVTITAYQNGGVFKDDYLSDVYWDVYPKVKVREVGGIKNGWRHNWTYKTSTGEEGVLPFSNDYANFYNLNYSDEVITVTITDHYKNQDIWGKVYSEGSLDFELKQWPKVKFEENIATTLYRVAEDGAFTVIANPSTGGYYEKADKVSVNRYSFKLGESESETNEKNNVYVFENVTANLPSGEAYRMTKETLPLTTTVYALGPDGTIWDKKDYSNEVSVYRRPIMPTSVAFKGNGTSKTVIPTMQASDATLNSLSYLYVYGIGNQVLARGSSDRYYIMNNAGNNSDDIWVATEWVYDNECRITSHRRFMSGETDYTEFSQLDSAELTSRADNVTGIDGVTTIENNVKIFNMSGMVIQNMHKGLNIIRNSEGKTIKVMIK